jgi:hypothetical protein
VNGTVERTSNAVTPTSTSGVKTDATGDGHAAFTDIKKLTASVTPTSVKASISLAGMPETSTLVTSPVEYSLEINGRRFDSFIRYPKIDPNAMTWDAQAAAYMPKNTSIWFSSAKHVDFTIPRSYLGGLGINAPYYVDALASFGNFTASSVDDRVPDGRGEVGLASAKGPSVAPPEFHFGPRANATTTNFQHDGGNVFYADQSTAGLLGGSPVDQSHHFSLNVPSTSDVTITLDWADSTGTDDLDLYVTGAADSGTTGASSNKPEVVSFNGVHGNLGITVEPYLVTDETNGVTYTLTAVVTPSAQQPVDTDGDGVPDDVDACPTVPGNSANGCPTASFEKVLVYIDGIATPAGSQDVDTSTGSDTFDIPVTVPAGNHTLRIDWLYGSTVRASETRSVSY